MLRLCVRCQVWECAGFAQSVSQSVEGAVEREVIVCFHLVVVTTWTVSRAGVCERLVLSHIVGGSLCAGGTSTTGAQYVSRQ